MSYSIRRASRSVIFSLLSGLIFAGYLGSPEVEAFQGLTNTWQPIGPPGGAVQVMAIDPNNVNTIYAGTGFGGVFKSTNGGVSWSQMSNGLINPAGAGPGQESLFVNDISISPSISGLVYLATMGGAYVSTNGGVSWSPAQSGLPGNSINAISVDPSNPNLVYSAPNFSGIYKSTNGGTTWSPANTGITNDDFQKILIDKSNPGTVYAAGKSSGIFKTINGGASWVGLTITDQNPLAQDFNDLAIDPSNTSTVYISTDAGLFRSTNGGANFSRIGLTTLQTVSIEKVAVDPRNSSIIYVGFSPADVTSLFESTDGGVTFFRVRNANQNINASLFAIDPVSEGTVYVYDLIQGVLKTTNGGSNWSTVNAGLTSGEIESLVVDSKDPDRLFSVVDTLGGFKSIDGGATWKHLESGVLHRLDFLVVDPINPSNLYGIGVTVDQGAFESPGVFKSSNGGASWSEVFSGDVTGNNSVSSFTIDPSTPTTLYVGSSAGIMRSTDGGVTWNPANSGLTSLTIQAVTVDPSNSNIVYAGAIAGIFKSTSGSANWTPINTGLTNTNILSVAVDPHSPNNVYLGTNGDGVFSSVNGGQNWSPVNAVSPIRHLIVNSLAVDPSSSSIIYAGTTDKGVFKSVDAGSTWTQMISGMINSTILFLAIDPISPNVIYAGSEGNGVYAMQQTAAAGVDLRLTVTHAETPEAGAFIMGGKGTVVLNVRNVGSTATSGSTVVTDTLPAGLNFVSASGAGWSCSATGQTVTCTNPNAISSGSISNVNLTVNVSQSAQATLTNGATVSNAQDTNTANNSATDTISVITCSYMISSNNKTFTNDGGTGSVNVTTTAQCPWTAQSNAGFISVTNALSGFGNGTVNYSVAPNATTSTRTGTLTIAGLPFTVTESGVNPLPIVTTISPNAAIPGSAGFTLTVNGSNFVTGAVIQWDGVPRDTTFVSSTQLTTAISADDIAASNSVDVNVVNPSPGGGLSNTVQFNIVQIFANDSKTATAGQSVTVSTAPTRNGLPGETSTLTRNAAGSGTATITASTYSDNPTSVRIRDVGAGFMGLQVTGSSPADSATTLFYYSSFVSALDAANLQLFFFDGAAWQPVLSSGGVQPIKDTTANLDHTQSGGRFTVVFDNTSTPRLSDLSAGTIFTMSVTTSGVLYGDVNGDGVIDSSDLVLLANILAGNVNLSPPEADVFLDGSINATDLVTLANFLAGNIVNLPVVPTNSPSPSLPMRNALRTSRKVSTGKP